MHEAGLGYFIPVFYFRGMSRIVYPHQFSAQRKLFISIKQKHDADGPASSLHILLSENNIDLVADEAAGNNADSHHSTYEDLSRLAEQLSEERNNLFKPAWKNLQRSVQFLKALYPQNVRRLGDWTITVNQKDRIAYPRKFSQRAQMVVAFIAKHNSFPVGSSPLQIFLDENAINLATDLANVNAALLRHDEFEEARRMKEAERELRDTKWKPARQHIRIIGSYVKSLFRGKVHQAGDYGFTVNSSPAPKKTRTTRLSSGSFITIKGIVIGSKFINKGNSELHLFKSRKTKDQPVVISPDSSFEIPKGYSVITVFNPSKVENGVFTTLWRK
jgi:hypothetical protein